MWSFQTVFSSNEARNDSDRSYWYYLYSRRTPLDRIKCIALNAQILKGIVTP